MDSILLRTMNLFLSASALPALSFLIFSLAYWGKPVRPSLGRVLLFAVLFSLYTSVTVQLLPSAYHIVNALAAHVLLQTALLGKLKLGEKLRIAAVSYFLVLFNEGVFGGIPILFVSQEQLMSSPLIMAAATWPGSLLALWAAWRIRRKQGAPGMRLLESIRRNRELGALFLFLFLQFFSLVLVSAVTYDPSKPNHGFVPFLAFGASGFSLLIIIFAIRLIAKTRDNAVRVTQEHYIDNMNRLFTTIRGQRHDFLNHVQVIRSFLKMKKYEDLERYAGELVGEITDLNEIVQIGHPALSALIQAKLLSAETGRIKLTYSFSGMDKLALGVKSVDIVKIMGNLIDNAMDEVMKLEPEERWIEVTGSVEGDDLWLTARNGGRVIPETVRSQMFTPGYTTKGEGHHSGIGLSIVQERVEYYKGAVQVESSLEEGTVFTIRIPLSAKPTYIHDLTYKQSV